MFCATTVSPAPVLVKNDDKLVALAPVSPQMGTLPAVEPPSFKSVDPKRGPVPKPPPWHDERTWFSLFSVSYSHCEREGNISRSHCQAHTLDAIAIGHSPISNVMLVYSPPTKRYYEPDSYCLDPFRLPSSVYPDLRYDGGLFCSLVHDGSAPMEELYPPGTPVEWLDPTISAGFLLANPTCSQSDQSCQYLHEGNAGWCTFSALARFLHGSTVQLSSAVSF